MLAHLERYGPASLGKAEAVVSTPRLRSWAGGVESTRRAPHGSSNRVPLLLLRHNHIGPSPADSSSGQLQPQPFRDVADHDRHPHINMQAKSRDPSTAALDSLDPLDDCRGDEK